MNGIKICQLLIVEVLDMVITITYELGYNFLKSCDKIEDWGCGAGGFKRFF